jgi:hypothetical protein
MLDSMAEREGFEPPIALRLCLISSQVHSTGLCHLSAFVFNHLQPYLHCVIQPVPVSCGASKLSTAEAVCNVRGGHIASSCSMICGPSVLPQLEEQHQPSQVYLQTYGACNATNGARSRVIPS